MFTRLIMKFFGSCRLSQGVYCGLNIASEVFLVFTTQICEYRYIDSTTEATNC